MSSQPVPSNKAFYLKPPQLTPGTDPDIKTTTTEPPAPATKPAETVYVHPRASVTPVAAPTVSEDEIDLPSPEPDIVERLRADDPDNPAFDMIQRGATARDFVAPIPSTAEYMSAVAKAMLPEAGPGRDSFFTQFMRSFAENSANAVDDKLLASLNEWLSRLIVTTTTVETALRDFGAATTEQGAQIDMKFAQLEKFLHELIWIRNMRQLFDTLGLSEYADAVIAREIYTEFGNGSEVEADIAKSKSKAFELEQFMRQALSSINKNLADLRLSTAPPKPEPYSPFRGPRRSGAPSTPPPVIPAPIRRDDDAN